MTTTKKWLTVAEVAEEVRVSKQSLLDSIRAGDLRATKLGPGWRIRPSDVDAWLDSHANITPVKRRSR